MNAYIMDISSQCALLENRRINALFNKPPIRLELQSSPYQYFPKNLVDARRKFEILKYKNNSYNKKTTQYSQVVYGFTQNQAYSNSVINGTTKCPDLKNPLADVVLYNYSSTGSNEQTQQTQNNTNNTITIDSQGMRDISLETFGSSIENVTTITSTTNPQLLINDIILYNYNTNVLTTAISVDQISNNINIYHYNNIIFYDGIQNNMFYLNIKNYVNRTDLYNYSLSIPIALELSFDVYNTPDPSTNYIVSISNNPLLSVQYGGIPISFNSPPNITFSDTSKDNTSSSASASLEYIEVDNIHIGSYYIYKNIGYINISNMDLYTENGYTYFFYFTFIINNVIPIVKNNNYIDLFSDPKICVRCFSTSIDSSYNYLNIHQINVNDVNVNYMDVSNNVYTSSTANISNMYQFDQYGNII